MTFTEKVLQIVSKIPKGKVMTYNQVASKAGSSNASRAVGTIMKNNYDEKIPCHRVIKSDGTVGEYNRGGTQKKKEILKREGVDLNKLNK
jgi:O-6-methylguanine DNA methyltransferase